MKVNINDREEFDYVVKQGYNPLMNSVFIIDHQLRIDIQRELFGRSFLSKGNVKQGNQRFYQWVWQKRGPVRHCEECGTPLNSYSSAFVSHILSRKGYPEMAHDPRNINILCSKHHWQWENDPRSMRIFPKNQETITMLKHEYHFRPRHVSV